MNVSQTKTYVFIAMFWGVLDNPYSIYEAFFIFKKFGKVKKVKNIKRDKNENVKRRFYIYAK